VRPKGDHCVRVEDSRNHCAYMSFMARCVLCLLLCTLGCRGHPETLDAEEDSDNTEWLPPARVDAGISGSGSGPAAGAAALIASLQAVQETGERFLVSIVASEVATTVAQAKVQDWEPEAPSRQSSATLSAWTEQLLAGFKVPIAALKCSHARFAALGNLLT